MLDSFMHTSIYLDVSTSFELIEYSATKCSGIDIVTVLDKEGNF